MHPLDATPDERASTSTSRSLLARVGDNDPVAWDRLIALYAPLVWHWCRKSNLPAQEIADVFQEVFQAVAAHIHGFRKDRPTDTFRGWLRTITKNKVLDHFRRLEREPRATGGSGAQWGWSQIPEVNWDNEEIEATASCHRLLQRALELIQADFEERSWRAFWRVVVDQRSPQAVAEELGMSPGAVRVAKCRVLHRLRQELGDLPV
jgi:RNA polymerase sigma-70 factor (ECF subfamily)